MKLEQFTLNPEVRKIIHELPAMIRDKKFSDVVDDAGHQYVDLVMEGGGMFGIALVGYVYVMEQMNIRFLQLAGTSAGAINTMLLAAAGPIEVPKTDWILEKMANKNFLDFVDGSKAMQDFVEIISGEAEFSDYVNVAVRGPQLVSTLLQDMGLNPGKNFLDWLQGAMEEKGIETTTDLLNLRKITPTGLRNRVTNKPYNNEFFERVAVIAADITTESKIEFPKMRELYWADSDKTNPANYARASMSVPLFFYPFTIDNIPQGEQAKANWSKHVDYNGKIPEKVLFVDGGTMSNFPINLFHTEGVPEAPTFGVKLSRDRDSAHNITSLGGMLSAMFSASRHLYDYEFLLNHPDYQYLISFVDTTGYNWLNFAMSDEQKIGLFVNGAKAASEFLKNFDWEHYKQVRSKLALQEVKAIESVAQ